MGREPSVRPVRKPGKELPVWQPQLSQDVLGTCRISGTSQGHVRPPIRPQPPPINAVDETLNPPFL